MTCAAVDLDDTLFVHTSLLVTARSNICISIAVVFDRLRSRSLTASRCLMPNEVTRLP